MGDSGSAGVSVPLTSVRSIDWRSALALVAGGALALALQALLCGCRCFGKRLRVTWRCCYEASLEDDRESLTAAQHRPSRTPTRCNTTIVRQSRIPALPRGAPIVRETRSRSTADDARSWNTLRDTLGPEVPDATLAELLETHDGDVDSAVQAFYATPRPAAQRSGVR